MNNIKDVLNWIANAKYLYPITATHRVKSLISNKNSDTSEWTLFSLRNASRIDHAYANTALIPSLQIETKYIGAFDHKELDIHINSKNQWGKDIWKLNTSLLQKEHQKEIRNFMANIMTEIYFNTLKLLGKI